MYKLILAAALATLVSFSIYKMSVSSPYLRDDSVDRQMFNQWLMQNGKSYGNDDEKEYRFQNFKLNIIEVEENTSTSYELGLNKFADLNTEEFIAQYTGQMDLDSKQNYVSLEHIQAPESLDWVEKGKVNPVQNQGACGSCWAFSATVALETRMAIDTGSLPKLSEQALVDCDNEFGSRGCHGGWYYWAFQWSAKYGMPTEKDYPYTAKTHKCNISGKETVKTNKSHVMVKPNDNSELVKAISQGVVSVAVNAGKFQLYKSGIYNNWRCNNRKLNHAIAAVGYGVDSATGKKFYRIRNSWGSNWGEEGYIRQERKDTGIGMCGVTVRPSYPTN